MLVVQGEIKRDKAEDGIVRLCHAEYFSCK